jgi:sensor histidine kinase YesM
VNAVRLRESWRATWSSAGYLEGAVPEWTRWAWSIVFNTAIALGLTILAWGFGGMDVLESFKWNFVIAQCIGLTIHGLYFLALRILGVERIKGFTWMQRVVFYAGLPSIGVLVGYGVGLGIMGVDVPQLVAQRPNILVAIVLLSVVLSSFAYGHFSNKQRLSAAEADRERARALAAVAERAALDAQLRALQAQIEPHFLFNTLANVLGLIDSAPADARRMLERLIALLRSSLTTSRAGRVSLAQEAELVRAYLDILSVRLGPRLAYDIDVPAELEDAKVPALLIQPLVENAVEHGVEPKTEGGTIRVRARAAGGALQIEVVDDGVGFAGTTAGGVGLVSVRDRLSALYGDRGRLTIEDAAPGVRMRLTLPLER